MKSSVNVTRDVLPGTAVRAVFFCMALVTYAHAGNEEITQCVQRFFNDDVARLKCYDQLAVPDAAAAVQDLADGMDAQAKNVPAEISSIAPAPGPERSYLSRVWNLDDLSSRDTSKLGRLQPYRQNYLLIRKTGDPNRQPSSPLPDHNVTIPYDMDTTETRFQLSFKSDIGDQRNIDFLGIKTFRLWAAYTQQSFWQMFNTRNSSPFRETIYEPELIATLGTGQMSGLKLINFGWVHQSNGQTLPESRSWNRLYLLGGLEWNDMTSIMVRGWWRIPEDALKDDNPDISDYLGRADMVIRWEPLDKVQAVALLIRNNLSRAANRGYMQLDWATPVRFGHAARMHIQMTSGFGESLIDYNHRQNTFGLGFSFREW